MTADDAIEVRPSRFVTLMGELARALAVRDDGSAVAADVAALAGVPLAAVEQQADWPSPLTPAGVPFELSLKLRGTDIPGLRCVVDVTDYRAPLGGDTGHQLLAAETTIGPRTRHDRDAARDLCRTWLEGTPPDFPARMMHGLGYTAPDHRRGSLYFRVGWMDRQELIRRISASVAQHHDVPASSVGLDPRAEVAAHDFVDGQQVRWKLYLWCQARVEAEMLLLTDRFPELLPCQTLMRTVPDRRRPAPAALTMFRQVSGTDEGTQQRLFFFCAPWGWAGPDGVAVLLDSLATNFDTDLSPLLVVRQTLREHAVRAQLGMVALGGDPVCPSITFYFWPLATLPTAEGSSRPPLTG